MIDLIQSVAVVFVFLGVWFISIPKMKGQWFMLVAQSLWVLYSGITKQWPLFTQSVVLFMINIRAIYNWKRKQIG